MCIVLTKDRLSELHHFHHASYHETFLLKTLHDLADISVKHGRGLSMTRVVSIGYFLSIKRSKLRIYCYLCLIILNKFCKNCLIAYFCLNLPYINRTNMIIIGIAGGTASGKSTVVRKIIEKFQSGEVAVLPQDSYYKDSSHIHLNSAVRLILMNLPLHRVAVARKSSEEA